MTSSEWELGFLGDENKTPPRNLGQFNPLSLVTGGTNDLQRNVQSITKDVEMYAYAQLGLQTVAAVATAHPEVTAAPAMRRCRMVKPLLCKWSSMQE